MGGKSMAFVFEASSVDRVWTAAVRALSTLGYTVLHSDSGAHVLSFHTGRSMSSWAGQDLSMTLISEGEGTRMTLGGSLAKGGNPFGGGSQMFAWGEKSALINRFAKTVHEILPSIPREEPTETEAPKAAGSVADELMKLATLRDGGAITQDEFDALKRKILD